MRVVDKTVRTVLAYSQWNCCTILATRVSTEELHLLSVYQLEHYLGNALKSHWIVLTPTLCAPNMCV